MNETLPSARGPASPWVCQFPTGNGRLEDRLPVPEGQSISLSDTACEAAERDGDPLTVCEHDSTGIARTLPLRPVALRSASREPCIRRSAGPGPGSRISTARTRIPTFTFLIRMAASAIFWAATRSYRSVPSTTRRACPSAPITFEPPPSCTGDTFGLGHGGRPRAELQAELLQRDELPVQLPGCATRPFAHGLLGTERGRDR